MKLSHPIGRIAALIAGIALTATTHAATSTTTSSFEISVVFSSATFSGGPFDGAVAEEFVDFEFNNTGFFDFVGQEFSTGAFSSSQTGSATSNGNATDPSGNFDFDISSTVIMSLASTGTASGIGSRAQSNASGDVFLEVQSLVDEGDILLVFDYAWERIMTITNDAAGNTGVAFVDASATIDTDNFSELTTIIDGSVDMLNIGFSSLGTLNLTQTGSGQLFFTLPAQNYAPITIGADIIALAEITAVPLPAAVWCLMPALGVLASRIRRG